MKSSTVKIFHIEYKIQGKKYTADIPATGVREAISRLAAELNVEFSVLKIIFPVEIK